MSVSPYERHYQPTITREANGGTQHIYRFENGYGASVVQHYFSYGHEHGLWELAVCRIEEDSASTYGFDWHGMWSGELENGLADDVHGHLTESEVQELLDQIAGL